MFKELAVHRLLRALITLKNTGTRKSRDNVTLWAQGYFRHF
jgi:hypothetical protein